MDHALESTLSRLADTPLASLRGRSLLQTPDFTRSEIEALLQLAETLMALDRRGIKVPLLPHELAYALFFDNSTRTKSAWAGAAARLGMQPVIVDGSSTQVAHGETAEETGAMLGMNAHALGVRHDKLIGQGALFMRSLRKGLDDYLSATGDGRAVPLVNLQCDVDHPTQTLADLLWLREHFEGHLAGKKVAVSWAYSPSYAKPLSVPQGLIMLLPRFGMRLSLAHPPGYELMDECLEHARRAAAEGGGDFEVCTDMSAAFENADVVYPKSWGPAALMRDKVVAAAAGDEPQLERLERQALEQNRQHTDWICNEARMAQTAGGEALYMHCLPADIGDEVTAGVYDSYRNEVAREANHKVYAIMALLASSKVGDLADRLATLTR